MELLVDIFGYLSIILHGLTIVAQSMMLGGILFLLFLVRPFMLRMPRGAELERRIARLTIFSAIGLIVAEIVGVGLQVAVVKSTVGLTFFDVMQAPFAMAGTVKTLCALLLIPCLGRRMSAGVLGTWLPLLLGAIELTAATFTTHAYARLDHNVLLLFVEGLHQFGAAIWIGAIPCFVLALSKLQDVDGWRVVGGRFSLRERATRAITRAAPVAVFSTTALRARCTGPGGRSAMVRVSSPASMSKSPPNIEIAVLATCPVS